MNIASTTQKLHLIIDFRGDLPVKDDVDVTDDDARTSHLILFGDPGSNSWIARALPRLPLTWTHETLTFAGACLLVVGADLDAVDKTRLMDAVGKKRDERLESNAIGLPAQ